MMHQLNALINKHCGATANQRNLVVAKSIALAIGYAAPIYHGQLQEAERFYNTGARAVINKLLEAVNEQRAVDIAGVSRDIHSLWMGRYYISNSPWHYSGQLETFKCSCKLGDYDLCGEVRKLSEILLALFKEHLEGADLC